MIKKIFKKLFHSLPPVKKLITKQEILIKENNYLKKSLVEIKNRIMQDSPEIMNNNKSEIVEQDYDIFF
tara:strand:+ start:746 stop:952 length:207 start_codon:yes stop_codon:yes gene_type:complete